MFLVSPADVSVSPPIRKALIYTWVQAGCFTSLHLSLWPITELWEFFLLRTVYDVHMIFNILVRRSYGRRCCNVYVRSGYITFFSILYIVPDSNILYYYYYYNQLSNKINCSIMPSESTFQELRLGITLRQIMFSYFSFQFIASHVYFVLFVL
jgi:hypothetical protein